MVEMDSSVIARFWERVAVTDSDKCWLWTGKPTRQGYGQFKVGHRVLLVHRIAYEIKVGEITDGQEIGHRCPNYHCVNWRHLKAGTHAEHMQFNNAGENHYETAVTHCPNGHPYDEENTYWSGPKRTWRRCRECHLSYDPNLQALRWFGSRLPVQLKLFK